jgi:hypothetical protein
VEDRNTPGLYMELLDREPDDYAGGRVADLLSLPGVERVSWWANLAPGRTELPMKVPDGTLLGVAEVSTGFEPPAPLAGSTALHFRRYPRPSQGCLTGAPTTGLLVVWISPQRPELAQQVRDWADFVHIRHIAAAGVPGYTEITPYENATGGDPLYMHLYEMDADDPERAYQAMPALVGERLGPASAEFDAWADWRAAGAHIVYCNTFRRIGASLV